MAIVRWRPFAELDQFIEELGRMGQNGRDLATDVYEENGNVIVEMQISGINPDKIDINVEGDHLRVTGTREEEHEKEKRNYLVKEIRRGTFERIIHLPAAVASNQTKAEVDHGVLRITLPKLSKAQPRKIKVESKGAGTKRKSEKSQE